MDDILEWSLKCWPYTRHLIIFQWNAEYTQHVFIAISIYYLHRCHFHCGQSWGQTQSVLARGLSLNLWDNVGCMTTLYLFIRIMLFSKDKCCHDNGWPNNALLMVMFTVRAPDVYWPLMVPHVAGCATACCRLGPCQCQESGCWSHSERDREDTADCCSRLTQTQVRVSPSALGAWAS